MVLERDSYLCQCTHCMAQGRTTAATEVDHRIPKGKGGTDSMANLQSINHECHKRKTLDDEGVKPKVQIGIDGYPVGGGKK